MTSQLYNRNGDCSFYDFGPNPDPLASIAERVRQAPSMTDEEFDAFINAGCHDTPRLVAYKGYVPHDGQCYFYRDGETWRDCETDGERAP